MHHKRIKWKSISLLPGLVALLVLSGFSVTEAATIQLKAQAEVNGSIIRLGDVADVYDLHPQNVQILRNITLAPAPVAGRTTRIDVDLVRSRLKANNVNLLAVEMSGKRNVQVRQIGSGTLGTGGFQNVSQLSQQHRMQQLSENQLKKSIQVYLQMQNHKVSLEEIQVGIRPEDRNALLAVQPQGYQITGGVPPWDRRQRLGVQTINAQGQIQQYEIALQLNERPTVVMAKYDIPRGQVLQADDLEERTVSHSTPMKDLAFNVEQLVGQEVKQPIRSGTPVRTTQLTAVEAVERGSMIKVYARARGIKVIKFYVAKQSGAIGEVIEVESLNKNRGRGKRLHVKIVGINEAELQLVPADTTAVHSGSRNGLVTR